MGSRAGEGSGSFSAVDTIRTPVGYPQYDFVWSAAGMPKPLLVAPEALRDAAGAHLISLK